MKNIAVINLLRLGDLLQTVPLLKSLKNGENVNITLICADIDIDIIADLGFVDNIVKVDLKRIANQFYKRSQKTFIADYNYLKEILDQLPFHIFDTVYNLNSLVLNSVLIDYIAKKEAAVFGPRFKEEKLIKDKLFSYLYAIADEKKESMINLSELYLSYLTDRKWSHNSAFQSGNDCILAKSRGKGREQIVINISTGDKVREFTDDFYVDLINKLSSFKKIIIVGIDQFKSESIMKRIHRKGNVSNLVAKTTIKQLYEILVESELFISPDTGTIHLAAISGVKILGLFNISAYYQLTGPYSNQAYFLSPDINCYPCEEFYQSCKNLDCRNFFKSEIVADAVAYIVHGKKEFFCDRLIFSKYHLDSRNGGYAETIIGKKVDNDLLNIRKFVKEMLFKVDTDFKFNCGNSIFWQEFVKIYIAGRREGNYIDLKRYIKENDRYLYLLELLNTELLSAN